MMLPPDDALALRMALEPLTHKVTASEGSELALTSIAISLKRIADAIEARDMVTTHLSNNEFVVKAKS